MKRHNLSNTQTINDLIFEYEAMSQKGTVSFLEETVFSKMIDFYEKELLFDKALELIDHAIHQHSFSAIFYMRKAQLLIEKNCAHQALQCLDQAEVYAPSDIEIYLLKAEAYCSLKIYKAAFEILRGAKDQTTSKEDLSEIYLYEATIFESLEQFNNMFIALNRALSANPFNKTALERVWFSVELSRKYKESVVLHQAIIDADPYSFIAWYNLGHAYSCLNKIEDAAEAFEYAFLIDKDFQHAYRDCAEMHLELKNYPKALDCLMDALALFEEDSDLLQRIGQCHLYMDELNEAKVYFIRAIKLNSLNADVHFYLGECFAKEKKWKSAIKTYRRAIDIDDRKEEYIAGLAEAYYQVDEIGKAKYLFSKAADTAPETSKYWIQYASFLMDIGEEEEALAVLKEAEIYAPGPVLNYCQVACLYLLDRIDEALDLLYQALSENFPMHSSIFELVPEMKENRKIRTLISSFMN